MRISAVTSSPSSRTRSPTSMSLALGDPARAAASLPAAASADRAVHRPRVEVREAEPLGDGARDRGLAGPGRAVDGDDHGGRG